MLCRNLVEYDIDMAARVFVSKGATSGMYNGASGSRTSSSTQLGACHTDKRVPMKYQVPVLQHRDSVRRDDEIARPQVRSTV